jgi:hypothetical protein
VNDSSLGQDAGAGVQVPFIPDYSRDGVEIDFVGGEIVAKIKSTGDIPGYTTQNLSCCLTCTYSEERYERDVYCTRFGDGINVYLFAICPEFETKYEPT